MNPHLIRGHSHTGVPIVNHIDLVEPVTGRTDLVVHAVEDEPAVDELAVRRGRRPKP
jgi:hypothetical protein